MRPKRDPVPRAKDAWVWLGGTMLLGILGAGIAAAAVLLWENVDIRQLAPGLGTTSAAMPEPALPPGPAAQPTAFTAVLFESDRNREYFPDASYYRTELERWRDLIRDVGGEVREAADADALRALTADEVLVLAEAPCLSPAELEAVRSHLTAGGSIVSNWAVGVRDGQCEWRGWGTILELTEAEEVQELPSRDGLFLTVPAGVALSPGFDPGTRIELRPDPSLALRMEGPRVYWSDWALNPAPDEGGLGADVATVAKRTPEGGRTAWFGLRVGQAATPRDSVHLRKLVQNGVLWAAGQSMAAPTPWPSGARSAMVFSLDVEDQPRNAMDVAAFFEAEGLPATFFAVSQLVADDGELAAALLRAGEVASQTADHTRLAGLTPQDQSVRLRRSWSEIESWVGRGPAGLRPPEEAFDSTTVRAWRAAGGEYILATNDSRSASPEIHPTEEGPVVMLPRLLKDDYNVVVLDGAIRAERIGEAYVAGASKVHAIGGLAVVAAHTQIMQSGRRVAAFRTVANKVRSDGDWWVAPAVEVARWWAARAGVTVTFVASEGVPLDPAMTATGEFDVLVRGPASGRLSDLWVDLVLGDGLGDRLPLVDGRSVDFQVTEWGARVRLGPVGAGEERRVSFAVHEGEQARPGT